ncbi:MAG: glycosyltransferase family 2 protein [Gemmatimonadetes bacterium]|nr:glycosyltransferase family 2 protein [Gemmatimonadota bacterium]
MTPLLFALPWIGVLAFLILVVRPPRELPPAKAEGVGERPRVSVIIPARNEKLNIENCVASVSRSLYPDFEIIVVDDRSDDDTAAIARALPIGNARRIRVVDGKELPVGWLGKPWACCQGFHDADGDVLLFTDADTTHGPQLLARAVAGMRDEKADLMTVLGRQIMGSFWERPVQPQVFLTMVFRFPRFERTAKNGRWRDAIANGQYILMPRTSYLAIGGHEAVRDEVVEDLALAQLVKREGLQLRVRMANKDFATRMYRSLGGIIEGWSKNILMGGLQSLPPVLRPFMFPVALTFGVGLWLVPPLVLLATFLGAGGPALFTWSATVCAISAIVFAGFTRLMGGPARYGLLYPLGAVMGNYIFLRSWIRGRNVEWKGRRYTVPDISERP